MTVSEMYGDLRWPRGVTALRVGAARLARAWAIARRVCGKEVVCAFDDLYPYIGHSTWEGKPKLSIAEEVVFAFHDLYPYIMIVGLSTWEGKPKLSIADRPKCYHSYKRDILYSSLMGWLRCNIS